MTTRLTFTAVFESVEDGWVQAHLRELPGVVTVAPTREQAEVDLLDALAEYLGSLGDQPDHRPLDHEVVEDAHSVEVVIRAS